MENLKDIEAIQTSLSSSIETNKELDERVAKLSLDLKQLHSCMKQEQDAFEMEKESFQNTITQQQTEIQIARLELAKINFAKSEIEVAMSCAQQDMTQARKTVAHGLEDIVNEFKIEAEMLPVKVERLGNIGQKQQDIAISLSSECPQLTAMT